MADTVFLRFGFASEPFPNGFGADRVCLLICELIPNPALPSMMQRGNVSAITGEFEPLSERLRRKRPNRAVCCVG